MRRAKLGDVYAIKVSNGYKIYQWGYRDPTRGDYIRVFDGLYDAIPKNISQIVEGPHSYIIAFFASRAYRIGLAELIGNYSIPKKYPFPDFRVRFCLDQKGNIYEIWLMPNTPKRTGSMTPLRFPVNSIEMLPPEYRDEKLLNSYVTPGWLLYLFDYGFDLSDPRRFYPKFVLGDEWEKIVTGYVEIVDQLVEKDRARRKNGRATGQEAVPRPDAHP